MSVFSKNPHSVGIPRFEHIAKQMRDLATANGGTVKIPAQTLYGWADALSGFEITIACGGVGRGGVGQTSGAALIVNKPIPGSGGSSPRR